MTMPDRKLHDWDYLAGICRGCGRTIDDFHKKGGTFCAGKGAAPVPVVNEVMHSFGTSGHSCSRCGAALKDVVNRTAPATCSVAAPEAAPRVRAVEDFDTIGRRRAEIQSEEDAARNLPEAEMVILQSRPPWNDVEVFFGAAGL